LKRSLNAFRKDEFHFIRLVALIAQAGFALGLHVVPARKLRETQA